MSFHRLEYHSISFEFNQLTLQKFWVDSSQDFDMTWHDTDYGFSQELNQFSSRISSWHFPRHDCESLTTRFRIAPWLTLKLHAYCLWIYLYWNDLFNAKSIWMATYPIRITIYSIHDSSSSSGKWINSTDDSSACLRTWIDLTQDSSSLCKYWFESTLDSSGKAIRFEFRV